MGMDGTSPKWCPHALIRNLAVQIDLSQFSAFGNGIGRFLDPRRPVTEDSRLSQPQTSIPRCPNTLAILLRVAPLGPISLSLTACSRRIAKRHAGLFRRLGEFGSTRFILDPTDLPLVLILDPNDGFPSVKAVRRTSDGSARISGRFAALLGLVHGAYDGDALFFSRDLVIEGDTAATLALRNAVDDAELDIAEEVAAMSGPFARPLAQVIAAIERHTGVFLTRPDEGLAW